MAAPEANLDSNETTCLWLDLPRKSTSGSRSGYKTTVLVAGTIQGAMDRPFANMALEEPRAATACTSNLGTIEQIGYMARNEDPLARNVGSVVAHGINEHLLGKIIGYAILQQTASPVSLDLDSRARMVTDLTMPQPPDSMLRPDARSRLYPSLTITTAPSLVPLSEKITAKVDSTE